MDPELSQEISSPKKNRKTISWWHDHPILERIGQINEQYVEDSWQALAPPTDPQEFLDWWWTTLAENCTRCVLSSTRIKVVKPDGDVRARIMIVGEGPGVMEDGTGVPMVGPLELRSSRCGSCANHLRCWKHKMKDDPSSRLGRKQLTQCAPQLSTNNTLLLRKKFFLQSAGAVLDGILIHQWKYTYPRHNWIELYNRLHPDNPWEHESPFFITNTVCCRSWDQVKNVDVSPGTVSKNRCRAHLAAQWAAVQPVITIALGKEALEVLIGAAGQTKARAVNVNDIITTPFGPVIYQQHPAYFMREENQNVKGLQFAKLSDTIRKSLEFVGLPVE